MRPRSPHIIIIGGGVIGSSIAYYLAKEEARVTLIEAGDLASGAFSPLDAQVNPINLTLCFALAAKKNHVKVLTNTKVVGILQTIAGLRPYTPDGLPVLGPISSLDGFVMAAGHEGDGIALSPITGDLMAKQLLGKKTTKSLDPFSPKRFEGKGSGDHA